MTDKFNQAQVIALAAKSSLVHDVYHNGRVPIGAIKGIALVYARVLTHLADNDPFANAMAAPVGLPAVDALAHYGMASLTPRARLNDLFTLMVGLMMCESSGNFCEGRDITAAIPVSAVTAEAGLFQMSWDITAQVPLIRELSKVYSNASEAFGLGAIFHEGVHCTQAQLRNFGTGPGADYQKLAKAMPAFAVESAAIGLRKARHHWGPINRKEAQVRPAARVLFQQIAEYIDTIPAPQPATEPKKGFFARLFGG